MPIAQKLGQRVCEACVAKLKKAHISPFSKLPPNHDQEPPTFVEIEKPPCMDEPNIEFQHEDKSNEDEPTSNKDPINITQHCVLRNCHVSKSRPKCTQSIL